MMLHKDPESFIELVAATANSLSLPMIYVEKDYWVTYLLNNLSYSNYKHDLVFKGGTSLSKAYKLINRFSEDIDLAVCIDNLSEHKLKKLMRNAEDAITDGFNYVQHDLESKKGNIRKTYYSYPKANKGEFGQVSEHILLEINCFSKPFPFHTKLVQSFVGECLNQIDKGGLVNKFH